MSTRIHALAKELNVQSKELIEFINKRQDVYGLDIKTPSNAIATLYVELITKDFQEAKLADNIKEEEPVAPVEESKPEEATVEEVKPEVNVPEPAVEAKAPEVQKVEEPKESVNVEVKENKPATMVPPKFGQRAILSMPSKVAPAKPIAPVSGVSIRNAGGGSPAKVPPPPMASKPNHEAQKVAPPLPPRISTSNAAPSMPKLPSFGVRAKVPAFSKIPFKPVVQEKTSENIEENVSAEKTEEKGKGKTIQVKPPIIVRDFAKSIELKPFRLISELMDMGIFASMNQSIEEAVAIKIAQKHGFELDIRHRGEQQQRQIEAAEKKAMAKKVKDDIKNYVERPPIVCILGHVDHGKTTLLDTIRNANVVAGEAGGITQHTAAYQVECNKKKITFLDTPGHAAFSKMRERGANVTDIAILIVAADDGFMPQTDEALNFAQKAGVPIVVAINKMDAKGANIDRVKQQMQKRGITSEDWGGETLCTPISGLKGTNIDKLLELVLLQAELMELKANPKSDVEGVIIESQVEQGRGATATLIVRSGTLKLGDVIVCNENWCKVRALLDDKGKRIKEALPATPAVIMGWTGAPEAGEMFQKVDSDREARRLTEEFIIEKKKAQFSTDEVKQTSLDDLMAAIAGKDKKVFKCIVKSDVSGTVEALAACLEDIKSDKVGLEIIDLGVGQITKTDVDFASTASASIVAFNVKQENGVSGAAKHKGVNILTHNIIYELINQVRDQMKNLLDPELKEHKLGAAEVRALFNVTKGGKVAGCMVTEGLIKRDKFARVLRKSKEIVQRGRIIDLKRFKEDAGEVRAGYECGLSLNNFNDFEAGDIVECFEILEIRPEL